MADSAKNMFENEKIADLKKNVKDSHSKQHQTTDYGIKVADLDHWLKVVDEENDKVGPSLLEDQIARERVCTSYHLGKSKDLPRHRFIASTTSVSLNVSSMLEGLVLMANSSSSRVLRMSPPLGC